MITLLRVAHDPSTGAPDFLTRLAGKFIVFDGPDGSGKTTQFERFMRVCRGAGLAVCDVREPGGTEIGERIRDILLFHPEDTEAIGLRCEMLLYMASRAQLVEQRIRPCLAQRQLVLADRFVSSTLAYQGAAGGLPVDEILAVARVACAEVWPDLVVIFDVDEATAAARMGRSLDRMESKGAEFHRRVRRGYLELAEREPGRVVVVDARAGEAEVAAEVLRRIGEWVG